MLDWLVGAVLGVLIGWLVSYLIGWLLFRGRHAGAVDTLLAAHAARPAPFNLEALHQAQQTLVPQNVLTERQIQEFRNSWSARILDRRETEFAQCQNASVEHIADAFAVPAQLLGRIRFGAAVVSTAPVESAAGARARETLQHFLSASEKQQLEEFGFFEIPSKQTPGRVYRIKDVDSTVLVLEAGKKVMHICTRPTDSVPWPDVMLAYKLGLEADEKRWLATANRWPLNRYYGSFQERGTNAGN